MEGLTLELATARRRGGAGGSEGVERDRVRAPGAQGCQDDTIPG